MERPNVPKCHKRDDTNKQVKRIRKQAEDADMPIYTDRDETFPPNLGNAKQEEAVSLAKMLVSNLFDSGNVFVHNTSPTSGDTLPQTRLSKRSQKLLMRYDSSSVLGVGGRNGIVDSPWNTPKVQRAKTPLFSDWSPFNGNVDDSLVLSRKQSILKLAISTDDNQPNKVKLKPSPDCIERSSSQRALSIYSTIPTSLNTTSLRLKSRPAHERKKALKILK